MEENQNTNNLDEIEKQSYSPRTYKQVQKLRQKGKLRGVDVPYLKYPLKSQQKVRPLFVTLGVLNCILLALACAVVIYLSVTVFIPLALNLVGITTTLTTKIEFDVLGIFSLFGSLISILLWLFEILFVFLAVTIIVSLTKTTLNMFGLTKASMQEVAYGHTIKKLSKTMVVGIIVSIIACVCVLIFSKDIGKENSAILVGIIAIIVAVLITILALIIVEKKKAKKEFEKLPSEQQENFKAHFQALNMLSKRKKNFTGNIFSGVDF